MQWSVTILSGALSLPLFPALREQVPTEITGWGSARYRRPGQHSSWHIHQINNRQVVCPLSLIWETHSADYQQALVAFDGQKEQILQPMITVRLAVNLWCIMMRLRFVYRVMRILRVVGWCVYRLYNYLSVRTESPGVNL